MEHAKYTFGIYTVEQGRNREMISFQFLGIIFFSTEL